jgi:branched chain amino acid efflux pump
MATVTILLMAAVTFATRFCFFGPVDPDRLPVHIERALPYVLPAVLMALIVPAIVFAPPNPGAGPEWLTPYLTGALAGFAVGVFKRDNFFLVFAVGVAAFAVTKLVL